MFKNQRAIKVSFVKVPKDEPTTANQQECNHLTFEKIDKIVSEKVKLICMAGIGVYAAVKVIDAASEIAIQNKSR